MTFCINVHLFSDGLGTLKDTKAKIHVQEGITRKCFKPRMVPNVLRAKVEKELDRLVLLLSYNLLIG